METGACPLKLYYVYTFLSYVVAIVVPLFDALCLTISYVVIVSFIIIVLVVLLLLLCVVIVVITDTDTQ